MIKVNLRSGETLKFDLKKDKDLKSIESLLNDSFPEVTALAIFRNKVLHSVPLKNINITKLGVELIKNPLNNTIVGERIFYQFKDITMSYLVYWSGENQVTKTEMIVQNGKR